MMMVQEENNNNNTIDKEDQIPHPSLIDHDIYYSSFIADGQRQSQSCEASIQDQNEIRTEPHPISINEKMLLAIRNRETLKIWALSQSPELNGFDLGFGLITRDQIHKEAITTTDIKIINQVVHGYVSVENWTNLIFLYDDDFLDQIEYQEYQLTLQHLGAVLEHNRVRLLPILLHNIETTYSLEGIENYLTRELKPAIPLECKRIILEWLIKRTPSEIDIHYLLCHPQFLECIPMVDWRLTDDIRKLIKTLINNHNKPAIKRIIDCRVINVESLLEILINSDQREWTKYLIQDTIDSTHPFMSRQAITNQERCPYYNIFLSIGCVWGIEHILTLNLYPKRRTLFDAINYYDIHETKNFRDIILLMLPYCQIKWVMGIIDMSINSIITNNQEERESIIDALLDVIFKDATIERYRAFYLLLGSYLEKARVRDTRYTLKTNIQGRIKGWMKRKEKQMRSDSKGKRHKPEQTLPIQ